MQLHSKLAWTAARALIQKFTHVQGTVDAAVLCESCWRCCARRSNGVGDDTADSKDTHCMWRGDTETKLHNSMAVSIQQKCIDVDADRTAAFVRLLHLLHHLPHVSV